VSQPNEPADPDPARTPGLEPGGGVAPGDTPPAAEQTTHAIAPNQTKLPSRRVNTGIAVGVVVVLVLIALLLFLRPW
jgi:hypothetical protein